MSTRDDTPASVAIFFTNEFKRNVRQLAKKYRRIRQDIQPTIDDIAAGNTPGDRIPGVLSEIYKARARNTDSSRGKSGGYRIIYQRTSENTIILITLYSKTEQSDVSLQEIQSIVTTYKQTQQEQGGQEAAEYTDIDNDEQAESEQNRDNTL
jgi:mRNA-degrading endonuclease RelE of RelBE toxin-antitoxin system